MSNWQSVLKEFPVSEPEPTLATREIPVFEPHPKVILFDVYGTLVCPLVGDLSEQTRLVSGEESFVATAERFGFSKEVGLQWHGGFFEAIAQEHRDSRDKGISQAEVQVDQIWAEMIARAGGRDGGISQARMVAAYREMQANPVRAFSGAAEALKRFKAGGMQLGIVSNSQFYTLPILGSILGFDPDQLFMEQLTFLSFRLGFAKPSPYFFRLVRTTLLHLGVKPEEALVVGNDCENDVLAAREQGLQSVLFYGNDQSVRLGGAERPVSAVSSYESLLKACGF